MINLTEADIPGASPADRDPSHLALGSEKNQQPHSCQ